MAKEHVIFDLLRGDMLGDIQDSLFQAKLYMSVRGITVDDYALWTWRSGLLEGSQTARRLKCLNTLLTMDLRSGYERLSKIIGTALDLRTTLKSPTNPQGLNMDIYPKYNPIDFTNKIADESNIRPQSLRQALRGLRIDLAYQGQSDPTILGSFQKAANKYVVARGNYDNSQLSATIKDLQQNWNGSSITDFYKILYQHGPTSTGVFLPYEIEAFATLVKKQKSLGSRPSPFIWNVMNDYGERQSLTNILNKAGAETGIPYTQSEAIEYIDLLLSPASTS